MSSNSELKEGDIVLCTVTQIENANVIVAVDEHNCKGNLIFSEISPGRIRNIREFVSIGKKIAAKVLRKNDAHTEVSLRRVPAKERDDIVGRYKKDRIFASMLKPILGDKTIQIIEEIKKEGDIVEIYDKLRETPEIIKKFIAAAQFEQLKKQLAEKKDKEKVVHKTIVVKSSSESGIKDIRTVLTTDEADISYLGSSQFLVRVKGREYKQANTQLDKVLAAIKDKAKTHKVQFEIK